MKTLKVQNKQNLFDIAVQAYGNIEKVLDLAIANDKSVTSELSTGEVLNIPEVADAERNIVDFFETRSIKPATASTLAQNELLKHRCGIGCMIIGSTFIVGNNEVA